ncbi:HNH endonuclease [Vreelandella nanhaiensis]|uniref:HNH endonuclease n=1 Tax=Vreelandella nanhaiensis TaxID=1258546 RepID=UPI00163BEC9F|nr:HNH endonuclease [Halomonas nanhaiensis]
MVESLDCLKKLRVGHRQGQPAPNKPCLLIAIICDIQSSYISSPVVEINDRLIARYYDIYEVATNQRSSANPHLPLWHLKSDKGPSSALWSPDFKNEFGQFAGQLGQPKSLKSLRARFDSARFNSELFNTFQYQQNARAACDILITYYFASNLQAQQRLRAYIEGALQSSEYEKHPEKLAGSVTENSQRYVRSAAFRSLVLEAYDYRCTATRLRHITPDYRYLVEAAHIIPFSESQDDRPTNGLALTPNLHWAMDNNLIAPGPDLKWHVSPRIDRLVTDNHWLCSLDGQSLVAPRKPHFRPDPDALTLRLKRLHR